MRLEKLEVLNYIPKKKGTQILYIQNRVENKHLVLSEEELLERRNSEIQRMNFILNYSEQKTNCRTKILLSYFGEEQKENCGICDVCRNNNKLELSDIKFKEIKNKILSIVENKGYLIRQICTKIKSHNK